MDLFLKQNLPNLFSSNPWSYRKYDKKIIFYEKFKNSDYLWYLCQIIEWGWFYCNWSFFNLIERILSLTLKAKILLSLEIRDLWEVFQESEPSLQTWSLVVIYGSFYWQEFSHCQHPKSRLFQAPLAKWVPMLQTICAPRFYLGHYCCCSWFEYFNEWCYCLDAWGSFQQRLHLKEEKKHRKAALNASVAMDGWVTVTVS